MSCRSPRLWSLMTTATICGNGNFSLAIDKERANFMSLRTTSGCCTKSNRMEISALHTSATERPYWWRNNLLRVLSKISKYLCFFLMEIFSCPGHAFDWIITQIQFTYVYVEIKCQLDATDGFFIADLTACSTCLGYHYAQHQELKSIIQWLLPVVLGAVVFKLLVWCGAEGYVSSLQDAAKAATTV